MPIYDIAVDIPERPKGDEIEVPPFGTVENGSTLSDVEMTREDAERYKNAHGLTVTQASGKKTDADRREEALEETESTVDDARANEGGE